MYTHLYEIVQQRTARFPQAVAFGTQQGLGWRTLTSAEFSASVDALARDLAERGVREGDRVVLWVPGHWRTPAYLFALWKLGAVAVPFDREMNPDAAAAILCSVEPRLVIAGFGEKPVWAEGAELAEWWEPVLEQVQSAKGKVQSDERTAGQLESQVGLSASPLAWTRPEEELAAIFFTSGTTGNPKGCMITHANLCSQVAALGENIPLDDACRLASILPISHLFELTCGLLYPFSAGAAIHYIPSRRGPDIVRVLSEQRITHMIAVPQLLTLMGNALDEQLKAKLPGPVYRALNGAAEKLPMPARRRLFGTVHRKLGGKLTMMASGGAALPPETQRLWERIGVRIVEGYGTSECSPVVACGAPDGSTPIGSVGKPLRGVEVRLTTEGELQVKGPNVMRGYWKDPQRTAEVLQDGWYATGDLASIDEAGNVRLAGRAKDLIVLPSGMNVWPQDVEDALRAHPAVKDACVIAVPSPAGATLHGYLIPASLSAQSTGVGEIVSAANRKLAQHQRLATASWWPEADFPRTTTLKVRRNKLPLPQAVEPAKVDEALDADDPVAQAISGVARVDAVDARQTLGELGFDSFGLVELALALEEKTGKSVADGDLRSDMTVADVRAFLSGAAQTQDEGLERAKAAERGSAQQPLWPYTRGRALRALDFPFDLLYSAVITRTTVLGREHLVDLPEKVMFAGTHRSYVDLLLIKRALASSGARKLAGRLVVASGAGAVAAAGAFARYGIAAFGLYPLKQYGDREASLRGLAKLAAAGNAVLIFPQGRHVLPEQEQRGDAEAAFKTGVAHLATSLETAVVPFGIAGSEHVIPHDLEAYRGPKLAGIPVSLRRSPLAIAFGAPLRPEAGEAPQAFTARLQGVCFQLARQAESSLPK